MCQELPQLLMNVGLPPDRSQVDDRPFWPKLVADMK